MRLVHKGRARTRAIQRSPRFVGLRCQTNGFRAAQETPLLHIERELVEMKYLTADGHQISANLNKSLRRCHGRSH